MVRYEIGRPALLDEAGGMDDRVGAIDQAAKGCFIQKIAQHQLGFDAVERGQRRPAPHQQAQLPAATRQRGDERRSDEAGGAGDRDQPAHAWFPPPLRGFREGEVSAQRTEGSWATVNLRLMTPPSPYDGDTSPREFRDGEE